MPRSSFSSKGGGGKKSLQGCKSFIRLFACLNCSSPALWEKREGCYYKRRRRRRYLDPPLCPPPPNSCTKKGGGDKICSALAALVENSAPICAGTKRTNNQKASTIRFELNRIRSLLYFFLIRHPHPFPSITAVRTIHGGRKANPIVIQWWGQDGKKCSHRLSCLLLFSSLPLVICPNEASEIDCLSLLHSFLLSSFFPSSAKSRIWIWPLPSLFFFLSSLFLSISLSLVAIPTVECLACGCVLHLGLISNGGGGRERGREGQGMGRKEGIAKSNWPTERPWRPFSNNQAGQPFLSKKNDFFCLFPKERGWFLKTLPTIEQFLPSGPGIFYQDEVAIPIFISWSFHE